MNTTPIFKKIYIHVSKFEFKMREVEKNTTITTAKQRLPFDCAKGRLVHERYQHVTNKSATVPKFHVVRGPLILVRLLACFFKD
jgi:hypothetical protein